MRLLSLIACAVLALPMMAALGVAAPQAAYAQGNDNDYTPLNSRIRRDRQLPLETRNFFREDLSRVERERSRDLVNVFSKCLWDRGNERAIAFLGSTDFGFVNFGQISLESSEAADRYSFDTCLRRVARRQNSGVVLRFTAEALRRWLLQEAYFDGNPDGANWAVAGSSIAERTYPLSANRPAVHTAMDFADCVVAQDPHGADYFFRTIAGSADESNAANQLMPSISPCIPAGQEMEITYFALRVWLGEGLWHASQNNSPPSAETLQEAP